MLLGPLPSCDLLKEVVLDDTREMPLHAQIKTSLRRLILDNFEDTSRFFSEAQLVDHLRVSQGTIRRALTDLAADGIIEKRRAKGTIVRKRSKGTGLRNLALFLPEYFSSNITQALTRLTVEGLRRQIHLQTIFTHQGENLLRACRQLSFRPHEGAVVLLANPPMATAELSAVLQERGYDCVTVDTLLNDPLQKFVGVNNKAGIELGMDHLASLGHRSIALLANEPEISENIQERIATFENYHRNNGLRLDLKVYRAGTRFWENSSAAAFNVMESICEAQPRPTAIFAVSDSGAISAVQWLLKRKIKVPEEMSVLGFDGSEFGALIHPSLTTLANPFQAFAAAVFDLLDKKPAMARRVLISPTLVVRDSTGPVPKGVS